MFDIWAASLRSKEEHSRPENGKLQNEFATPGKSHELPPTWYKQRFAFGPLSPGHHIMHLRRGPMNKEVNSINKNRESTIFLTVQTCPAVQSAYQQWFQVSCPSPRCEDGHLYRQHRWRPGCSFSLALSQGHPQQEWSPFPLSFQNLHDISPGRGKNHSNSSEISWMLHSSQNLNIKTVTIPAASRLFST